MRFSPVLLAPLGLAACLDAPGEQMHVRIDGRAMPLWTMNEMPQTAIIYPPTDSAEVASILELTDGRAAVYLPASGSPKSWDYGHYLYFETPLAADDPALAAGLLAASPLAGKAVYAITVDLGAGRSQGYSYSTGATGARIDLTGFEALPDGGFSIAGSYSGEACLDPAASGDSRPAADCVMIEGSFDEILLDRRD